MRNSPFVAFFVYFFMQVVEIECAGNMQLYVLSLICIENSISLSSLFMHITTILLSGFMAAVQYNSALLDAHAIRTAPGLINFEKCPM